MRSQNNTGYKYKPVQLVDIKQFGAFSMHIHIVNNLEFKTIT